MIDQVTVLLPNEPNTLGPVARALGEANVQMHALMIADTSEFGIVRIICDRPKAAVEAIQKAGYNATTTKVGAIDVPNVPGGLAGVLDVIGASGINVEYAYCFGFEDRCVYVFKVNENEGLLDHLSESGYGTLQPQDLYADDEL
ncbi:MAG: hypothetical protein IJ125_00340 [Atopobiaceae bacterium]|nr:hypothetical protein [Atopobiaceae bacterium]